MAAVFRARPGDKLIQPREINFIGGPDEGPNFLRGGFSNRGKEKTQSNLSLVP